MGVGTPVCRLCGRYLAILGRPISITVLAVTVAPTALVGSLIMSSNLPHSLQRGVLKLGTYVSGAVDFAAPPPPNVSLSFTRPWPDNGSQIKCFLIVKVGMPT